MIEQVTAAVSMRQKLNKFTEQTAKKINAICRRNHTPQDVTAAFIADAIDMLHGDYRGLSATTEQMRIFTAAIPRESWDKTENAALCFIAQYYSEIVSIMDGNPLIAAPSYHCVQYMEAAARRAVPVGELISEMGSKPQPNLDAILLTEARQQYYAYAILTIGEHTNATKDELATIEPHGVEVPQARRINLIESALDFQRQRARIKEAAAERRAAKKRERFEAGEVLPSLFDGSKTIALYQTTLNMVAKGIQTADATEDGRAKMLRPLREAIAEQRKAAEVILNADINEDATESEQKMLELQKKKAEQLLSTTTAVWQAIDAIQVIPQTRQPDGSGDTWTRYDMTPHELARIGTGAEHPNPEIITACMRAFAWLSTQRMQVFENIYRYVTERDENGVIKRDEKGKPIKKYVKRTICTDFQPLTIEFRSESENNVLIEDATRVRLHIHDIIQKGRSAEDYIDGNDGRKKYFKIAPPTKHVLQLQQFYSFKSDEERTFRTIIFAKPNLAEDKFLSAVFDYKGKQAQYDKAAREAIKAAEEIQADANKTEEEKDNAKKAAEQAEYKAKYYITNHMGDDVNSLKAMFVKAKDCGIITYYSRDEAKAVKSKKKYGSGFVWRWKHPNASEVSECRRRRKKQPEEKA